MDNKSLIAQTIINSTKQLMRKKVIITGHIIKKPIDQTDVDLSHLELYHCDGCHDLFHIDDLKAVGEDEASLCEGCRSKDIDPKLDLLKNQ